MIIISTIRVSWYSIWWCWIKQHFVKGCQGAYFGGMTYHDRVTGYVHRTELFWHHKECFGIKQWLAHILDWYILKCQRREVVFYLWGIGEGMKWNKNSGAQLSDNPTINSSLVRYDSYCSHKPHGNSQPPLSSPKGYLPSIVLMCKIQSILQ